MYADRNFEMKKILSLEDYANHYNNYLEEITRLQGLLAIEEKKLFELMQIKEQVYNHESQSSLVCK